MAHQHRDFIRVWRKLADKHNELPPGWAVDAHARESACLDSAVEAGLVEVLEASSAGIGHRCGLTPLGADLLASADAAGYDPDSCEMCEGAGVLINNGDGLHPAPSWDGPVLPRGRGFLSAQVRVGEAVWCACTRPASCKTCGGTKKIPVIGEFCNPCPDCTATSVNGFWQAAAASPVNASFPTSPNDLTPSPALDDASFDDYVARLKTLEGQLVDVANGPDDRTLVSGVLDGVTSDWSEFVSFYVDEARLTVFGVEFRRGRAWKVTRKIPWRAELDTGRTRPYTWARTPAEIERVLHEALQTKAKIECEHKYLPDVVGVATRCDGLWGLTRADKDGAWWSDVEGILAVRLVDAPAAEQSKPETLDEIEARLRSWEGREVQLIDRRTGLPFARTKVRGKLTSVYRQPREVCCHVDNQHWVVQTQADACIHDFALVDDLTLPSGRRFDVCPPGAGED